MKLPVRSNWNVARRLLIEFGSSVLLHPIYRCLLKVIKKRSSRETAKELPKKSRKPRRKLEPKKTEEETEQPKATDIIPTQTAGEKQENKEK